VLPFKMHRPTRRFYFLCVNFRPFSFFMCTTCAKINPGHMACRQKIAVCVALLSKKEDMSFD